MGLPELVFTPGARRDLVLVLCLVLALLLAATFLLALNTVRRSVSEYNKRCIIQSV